MTFRIAKLEAKAKNIITYDHRKEMEIKDLRESVDAKKAEI